MIRKKVKGLKKMYRSRSSGSYSREVDSGLPRGAFAIAMFFLAGAAIGTFSAMAKDTNQGVQLISAFTKPGDGGMGYLRAFCGCSVYIAGALLLSGTVFAFLGVPLLFSLRGYFMSAGATALIMAFPDKGVALALVAIGIPALLTVPCLVALALDALSYSKRLLILSAGGSSGNFGWDIFRHTLICIFPIMLAAACQCFLIPKLIEIIM